MFGLAPLLYVLPLLGVLFNGFLGRQAFADGAKKGEATTGWIAVGMSVASFVISLVLFGALANEPGPHLITLFDWINIPGSALNIPWEMQIDRLSSVMLLVITGVGSLIHIYATGYMHGDKDYSRFFVYLNLFLFFMIMLVTGSSYLTLFVGWEGVGLCSFLLIGFWFAKDKVIDGEYEGFRNSDAARKAFIANRVGDLCMIVAMALTLWGFGSLRFVDVISGATEYAKEGHSLTEHMVTFGGTNIEISVAALVSLICFFLLMGAAGKSAQIPLFVWLPDAMAGPTPVSALMHAATMVTSGIYLIVRSNVLFELARLSEYELLGLVTAPNLVALVGALTALYGGLVAFTQYDIKKVLAYSTVSQLGFMIAAIGMGAYVAGMFHLITHAFFKALLFMGAGSVIHGVEHGHHELHHDDAHGAHGHDDHHDAHGHDDHHEEEDFDPQDMRNMGGLFRKMPITAVTYIIGAFALAGIFPFAGFWSKDEILAHAQANEFGGISTLLTLAAICTAFYMARQLKLVFFGKPRSEAAVHAHESAPSMTFPLIVLAVLSTIGGLLNLPFFTKDAYEVASADHDYGSFLALEHWLLPSIQSFGLTEEGVLHMPHTPTWLQLDVAVPSTLFAIIAMLISFFVVYGTIQKVNGKHFDLMHVLPPFSIAKTLPFDSLYMKVLVPWFEKFGIGLADSDNTVTDGWLVGGVTGGIAGLSKFYKRIQSGLVRNYALSLFAGVVAVLVMFLFGGA